MQLFTRVKTLQKELKKIRKTHRIGFVPTMGALHEGHLSLVTHAQKMIDKVVVSIFVNPIQFDKKEDLINYPNTLQADLELLEDINCDIVFVPRVQEMYGRTTKRLHFEFDGLEIQMEGANREGHFNGVATIIKRFLEIIRPDFAFFGEKDFQQLQIVRKLIEKEHLHTAIIGHPTRREKDGLAMSSRNTRLTKKQRIEAPFIYKTLQEVKRLFIEKNPTEISDWVHYVFEKNPILRLEYFTIADEATLLPISKRESNAKYRAFIAAFAGTTRLIDNIALY